MIQGGTVEAKDLKVSIKDVAKKLTLRVIVSGAKGYRVRLAIASRLIALAAKLAWFKIEWVERGEGK